MKGAVIWRMVSAIWGASKWGVVSATLIERYLVLEEVVKGTWRMSYRDTL